MSPAATISSPPPSHLADLIVRHIDRFLSNEIRSKSPSRDSYSDTSGDPRPKYVFNPPRVDPTTTSSTPRGDFQPMRILPTSPYLGMKNFPDPHWLTTRHRGDPIPRTADPSLTDAQITHRQSVYPSSPEKQELLRIIQNPV